MPHGLAGSTFFQRSPRATFLTWATTGAAANPPPYVAVPPPLFEDEKMKRISEWVRQRWGRLLGRLGFYNDHFDERKHYDFDK